MATPYSAWVVVGNNGELLAYEANPLSGSPTGSGWNLIPLVCRSDPDFADAINALWTKTEADWPYIATEGSAIPMPLQGRDSPDCAAVANWLAQRCLGWFPGAALPYAGDVPAPAGSLDIIGSETNYAPHDVTRDDAPGTVPYVNPALVKDPEVAYILNYMLDNNTW